MKQRLRLQFRLRTMLLAMFLGALVTACLLARAQSADRQRAAVRHFQIHKFGRTAYDWQIDLAIAETANLEDQSVRNNFLFQGFGREPKRSWPREMLGDDFFDDVALVAVDAAQMSPKDLQMYKRLQNAHMLFLDFDCQQGLHELFDGRSLTALSIMRSRYYSRQDTSRLSTNLTPDFLADTLRQQQALQRLEISPRNTEPLSITKGLSEALSSLTRLTVLELRGCNASDHSFASLTKLKRCVLENCVLPAHFDLIRLTELKHLSLYRCDVDDDWMEHLRLPSELLALDIRRTKISPKGLKNLLQSRIAHLSLDASQIQPGVEQDLSMVSTLNSVEISGSKEERERASQLLMSGLPNVKVQ